MIGEFIKKNLQERLFCIDLNGSYAEMSTLKKFGTYISKWKNYENHHAEGRGKFCVLASFSII